MSPLTHLLRTNQNQDVIQIDNNIETLAMAKEQDRFCEAVKMLGAVASPKGKTFHWYGTLCQTNHEK